MYFSYDEHENSYGLDMKDINFDFNFIPFVYDDYTFKKCSEDAKNSIPAVADVDTEISTSSLAKYKSRSMTCQKSDDWLKARHECITASIVSKIISSDQINKTKKGIIIEKAYYGKYNTFSGGEYTAWGEKYEPVANKLYCYRKKTKIHDYGLIMHSEHSFIGASTDGITEQLINIEIKCPPNRVIDGKIPKVYKDQMQLQMEVLDLNLSHFVECKFIEYDDLDCFYDDFYYTDKNTKNLEKGIVIEIVSKDGVEFIYSPIELYLDKDEMHNWMDSQIEELTSPSSEKIIIQITGWQLDVFSCQEYKRDMNWFSRNFNRIKSLWNEVLKERESQAYKKEIEKDELEEGVCFL